MRGRRIAGGRSVAKILVADDNSNIQKMVALALKDQGIDVVAVGNGEAAVRKISDIRPDLVLADVFMPVRNGYEVCQYVKTDPSLAHIPVILLVGAFDPLDEQEAQRVGADGVLKKPFVPPDPLISMVKSALLRAGVALANAAAAKTPEPEGLKASDLVMPSRGAIPTLSSIPIPPVANVTPVAPLDQESFVDEVPARPEPVRIDSSSHAVAFGSLLEASADEKEEDPGFLPPANPEFATERDWRDVDEKETDEEEEEEKTGAPWRPEAAESYADAGSSSGAKDWRSGSFEQILARKTKAWEPAEETPEVVKTTPAASNSFTGQQVPASVPEATPAIPAIETQAWAPAASLASQEKSSTETATALEEVTRADVSKLSPDEAVGASGHEVKQGEPAKNGSKDSWFSVPANPWNAEMEKGNRLASAWDAVVPAAAPPASSNGAEKATEEFGETTQKMIEEAALPAAAVEAIREEVVFVAEEDATLVPEARNADGSAVYAHDEVAKTTGTPAATPSTDDLVARVLAKMSPEVLQAVTREILRPVVEAMVQEELKSKKS
jgi:CheY-like chemotaxis protein